MQKRRIRQMCLISAKNSPCSAGHIQNSDNSVFAKFLQDPRSVCICAGLFATSVQLPHLRCFSVGILIADTHVRRPKSSSVGYDLRWFHVNLYISFARGVCAWISSEVSSETANEGLDGRNWFIRLVLDQPVKGFAISMGNIVTWCLTHTKAVHRLVTCTYCNRSWTSL